MANNQPNNPNDTHETYKNLILQVAREVCENNKYPTCVIYERAIVDKLNETSSYPYKVSDVHSSVYRALNAHFYRAHNCYYPDKPKYRRMHYGNLIKDNVRFAIGEIHIISDNTCVVSLDELTPKYKDALSYEDTILIFKNFVGDNCYAIKLLDNLLIIMLSNASSDDSTTVKHISELVKDAYKNQPGRKLKRLKPQQ